MTGIRQSIVPLFAAPLLIFMALLLTVGAPTAAQAAGLTWQKLSVDKAIAQAKKANTRVLVAFSADWCSSCKQLEAQVLSTADGAALAANLIAVRVDFDAPANRRDVERYVILGLPTVVVLDGHGTQVGRVMGYESKADWLQRARAAVSSGDPLPALRKAHADRPDDGDAVLALGRALLVRGQAAAGEQLLEGLLWADGKGEAKAAGRAAEALFTLGRYYHRVRKQPRTARFIWRALALGHPQSPWAAGAWWWYARAEAEIGRHAVGLKALRGRAQKDPSNAAALRQWAGFVKRYKLHASAPEVRQALLAAKERLPEGERASIDAAVAGLDGMKKAAARK